WRLPSLTDRVASRGRRLLAALRLPGAELSLMLVSDSVMRRLNRDWRGRDRPTDVLSFAQREGSGGAPDGLLGDVVISVDTARPQAAERAETVARRRRPRPAGGRARGDAGERARPAADPRRAAPARVRPRALARRGPAHAATRAT